MDRDQTLDHLQEISYQTLLELSTDNGINASGKADVFSCIFGRDSALTILKILKACSNPQAKEKIDIDKMLEITKRALLYLTTLQGRDYNIESGEQPGKFIHEYRTENIERLLNQPIPWYVYPDNTIRNYDSLDSTPLILIALYRYYTLTSDEAFLQSVLPSVEKGLSWMMKDGDSDHDFLLEYELSRERKAGGLAVQSWTDSHESLSNPDGSFPEYPIAPVEVQGYGWLALRLWGEYFASQPEKSSQTLSANLLDFAAKMKKRFNETFVYEDHGLYFVAQILDGLKRQRRVVTGNALLLLWATDDLAQSAKRKGQSVNDNKECILEDRYISGVVKRSFMPDMFEEDAGIRTMSTLSPTFNGSTNSYHNGSFWPILNGMVHEGLEIWGFEKEAEKLFQASMKPLSYFKSMVELYIKTGEGKYSLYIGNDGQESCRQQAWSAAAALDLLTE